MTGQACPLRLVARYEDRGYVASGSRSSSGMALVLLLQPAYRRPLIGHGAICQGQARTTENRPYP
jgi:hypothetical protein